MKPTQLWGTTRYIQIAVPRRRMIHHLPPGPEQLGLDSTCEFSVMDNGKYDENMVKISSIFRGKTKRII